MSGRSRIYVRGDSDDQTRALVAIDEQFQPPFNATMLQWSMVFSQLPTTAEPIEVGKIFALGFGVEILFRSMDPVELAETKFVCNEHFEIARDETLFIRYPNSDGLLIYYEAVLTEVF